MHIILLNDDSLPKSQGGAAVVVDKLTRGYTKKGHKVTLVTTHQDPSLGPIVREDGVVSLLSIYPLKRRHRHCLGCLKMTAALTELFEELKPDAVHAHNIHSHLTYESLNIAKHHTDSVVLTAHDVFLFAFARVSGPRFEKLALEGKPIRFFWWEHLLSVGRKYWPLRNAEIRKILKESGTKVVALNNAHKVLLEANGISVAAVVPNGTDVKPQVSAEETSAFREKHGLTGPTILFGGRLSEDKGSKVLLEAFALVRKKVPDVQLLIAGEHERIADSLKGAEGLVTPGWLTPNDMRLAYSACAVATTPSLCFDVFPTMNLEAMAAGKPVVATCFGGSSEIVEDGETGFVVNPRDIDNLVQALGTILKDEKKAKEMGDKGREIIKESFSVEKQVEGYLGVLN